MNPIRTLTAREIECRVSQITKKGDAVMLLLYKDARCDMAILDETFGPMNWQRHHSRDNANCIISIWDESKGQWIEKEDTGTVSNTEPEKGLASDSFKRAGTNWGIGRELYTAPFIYIKKSPDVDIEEDRGKFRCNTRFEVTEIGYNEHREINRLVIVNSRTHNVVFEFGKATSQNKAAKVETNESVTEPAKAAETSAQAGYVTCERCFKAITGIVLPSGKTMTAAQVVGTSKLKYGGVFCTDCMAVLKAQREARNAE